MRAIDWTLLALASAGGKPLTPVQLQKALFLLGRELPKVTGKNYYRFVPHNFGPFDPTIYHDSEQLEDEGFVSVLYQAGRRWPVYSVTPRGLQRAHELEKSAPVTGVEYLRKAVKWARSLSFQQLVQAIYREYPEYRVNSIFRD